jgi:hypothetical protein
MRLPCGKFGADYSNALWRFEPYDRDPVVRAGDNH